MIVASLSSALVSLPLALQSGRTLWMPPQSSSVAPHMDDLFYFIFWLSMFFFVLITVGLIVLGWKYRQRPGHTEEPSPHHNFALELSWSVIPLILVIAIFWVAYKGFLDLITPPPNAMQINVTAQQWKWFFDYPPSAQSLSAMTELHVPVDTPVVLTMRSEDVLHSFFVPDFRVKQDVVPGRYTKVWFEAVEPGEHHLFCAEYCGKDHAAMITKVVVHEPGGFEKWVEGEITKMLDLPLPELGQLVFENKGCTQCHSVDGTANTGPTLQGIYGHTVQLADGTSVTADDNYIRTSLLDPGAQVVAGFDPVMPTFKGKLRDREIDGVIAYLKTLAE